MKIYSTINLCESVPWGQQFDREGVLFHRPGRDVQFREGSNAYRLAIEQRHGKLSWQRNDRHVMTSPASFPDRETVARKFAGNMEGDRSYLALLMENAAQDDNLIDGLHRYLDIAAEGKFLNTLKLETVGKWIGEAAPARLQIRLMEAAKSSQHPAYQAFRSGLTRSGGLERAYPVAGI